MMKNDIERLLEGKEADDGIENEKEEVNEEFIN